MFGRQIQVEFSQFVMGIALVNLTIGVPYVQEEIAEERKKEKGE